MFEIAPKRFLFLCCSNGRKVSQNNNTSLKRLAGLRHSRQDGRLRPSRCFAGLSQGVHFIPCTCRRRMFMHFLRLAAVALVLCSVATGSAFAQTKVVGEVTALL